MDIMLPTVLLAFIMNVGVQHADKLEAMATYDSKCEAKFIKQENANYGYDSVDHCNLRKSG